MHLASEGIVMAYHDTNAGKHVAMLSGITMQHLA